MPEVPELKLDVERTKGVAAIIVLCTAVAFLILVVDWKIKQTIIETTTEFRRELERAEKAFWRGDGGIKLKDYAGGFGPRSEPASASGHGVGGDAGMEKAADPAEDASNAWAGAEKASEHNSHGGRRSGPVAVPKAD